jgi:hypothetical protein
VQGGVVGDRPLESVGGEDRDAVARLHADLAQRRRDRLDAVCEGAARDRTVGALRLVQVRSLAGAIRQRVLKELAQCSGLAHAPSNPRTEEHTMYHGASGSGASRRLAGIPDHV